MDILKVVFRFFELINFKLKKKNISLLKKHRGDIEKAISELVANKL